MPGRFIELPVRARRLVAPIVRTPRTGGGVHLTGRRQLGGELTQFSFRLAFVIDLAHVGLWRVRQGGVGPSVGYPAAGGSATARRLRGTDGSAHDGDTILVKLGDEIVPGSVIVARVPDGEYVVKRVGGVAGSRVELSSLTRTIHRSWSSATWRSG